MNAGEHRVEQRLRTCRVALGGAQPYGREEPVDPADGIGCELRRPQEELGGGLRPAPVEHALRPVPARARRPRPERRGGGEMPGAPVDVVVTVEGIGEGAVGSTALCRRCAVVDGGPDQWVTKAHCGSERHETGCFDAGDRFLPWRSQQPRRPVKERRIAQSFRRREQQDGSTRRWQQTGAGGELILERTGRPERARGAVRLPATARRSARRQPRSARAGSPPSPRPGDRRPWRRSRAGDGPQQGSSVVLRQSEDHELGQRFEQVGETHPGVTHGEQHRDRIRVQPAGDERQHTRRLVVEPLRIVDDEKYRSFTRRVVEEREHGEEHHQGARRGAIGETEHRLQRGVAVRAARPRGPGTASRAGGSRRSRGRPRTRRR